MFPIGYIFYFPSGYLPEFSSDIPPVVPPPILPPGSIITQTLQQQQQNNLLAVTPRFDTLYTYPASDLDNPDALLTQLGTLWSTIYDSRDFVRSVCAAILEQQRQAYNDANELLYACSRHLIPVLHTENWYAVTLSASQVNSGAYSQRKFDGSINFDPSSGFLFGQQTIEAQFAWTAPSNLVAIPMIFNRISAPSVSMCSGIDYILQNNYLVFRDNPFDNPLIPQTPVLIDNVQTDSTITLWLFKSQFDTRLLYQQFGYVLGLQSVSTPGYKLLINALYDSLVEGSVADALQRAWSAITGVPLAKGNETVQVILTKPDATTIITDQYVYNFDPSATVLVNVDDYLTPGQAMTNALQFFEFNRGQTPAAADIPALALGQGYLSAGFFSDLVFNNQVVPLVVTPDVDGYTKLSWELGGWPGDVTAFFDQLHVNGIASGQTLAHLMDQRPVGSRIGEPIANALPATINPFQFLCQNVLRNNFFIVKVLTTAAQSGVGMWAASFLRKIIPPQTAMIVMTELAYSDDPITMDGPGTPTAPGYEEDVNIYLGMNVSETMVASSYMSEQVTLYQIAGHCV